MRIINFYLLLVASVLISATAHAIPMNFSYTFESGETLSGMLDGTISLFDPDVVTVEELLMAEYSGVGIVPPGPITFQLSPLSGFGKSGVSFSGSFMIFLTEAPDPTDVLGAFGLLNNPVLGQGALISDANFNLVENQAEFNPLNWSLTLKVPEPATLALMCIGVAGIGYRTLSAQNFRRTRVAT